MANTRKVDNPYPLYIQMESEVIIKLDNYAMEKSLSRSELIRRIINEWLED